MSDFIREVDEEYRRDRAVNFLSKYQWLLIAAAVGIVAATAGYRIVLHYQARAAEGANVRFEAATQLMREGKGVEAQAAFDKIQSEGPKGYAERARMQAVETLAPRDPAAGARGFAALAGDDGMDASLRDAAQVRSALIRIDGDDPKAFEQRYGPLAVSGFAFHSAIRELLALAAFKRNDGEAAGRWLDEIIVDQQAPNALRKRAEAFLGLVAAGPLVEAEPETPAASTAGAATPAPTSPGAAAPATPASSPAPPTTAAARGASPVASPTKEPLVAPQGSEPPVPPSAAALPPAAVSPPPSPGSAPHAGPSQPAQAPPPSATAPSQ